MNRFYLILALFLLSFTVLALVSCGNTADSTAPDTTPADTTPTVTTPATTAKPTANELLAEEMVATIWNAYGDKGSDYLNVLEHYGNNRTGYLWSNFSASGMQYYLCKLNPNDEKVKEDYRLTIENFLYFRHPGKYEGTDVAVKYHSDRTGRKNFGTGTCFFDDNIWVARNYLRAYEILGDKFYLEEAIRVNNWVLSGWNNELGGLVWSEDGLRDNANEQNLERGLSANACGAIVNAMLAGLATNEEDRAFHMEWAEKFYNFCKKMQNKPESYDYFNGIHTVIVNGVRKDGTINRAHYSYNSGSMIIADLLLYEITDDEEKKAAYMDDAVGTAAAAFKTFYRTDSASGKSYISGDPWFAAILHEAYYELSKYSTNKTYMRAFAANVKNGYANRDTQSGLLPYEAFHANAWQRNETYVIHQVGFAQQAVLNALWEKESKK